MDEDAGASSLQQFCLLAKTVKGPSCVNIIGQALDHPGIFVFAELLDMANIQALAGTPAESSLELLKLFAYGTWQDYKGRAKELPAMSEVQATKLKKLTVVTLSTKSKSIPYETLMQELEVNSVREVEDLLIDCIYGGLLQGKLDQQAGQLEVHYCIGRDIHPSEIQSMCDMLGQWHQNSVELLNCISAKIENYNQQCDATRAQQQDLDAKIENIKATLRAQQDAAEGIVGPDVEAFDEDLDKMRKSGRTKGKHTHALGVGPRK